MARSELPEEVSQAPLSYAELIDTLKLLQHEEVWLANGPVNTRGVLHHLPGRWDHETFSVGGETRMVLPEDQFIAASLSTHEGNSYFLIPIRIGQTDLVLGDPDLIGWDLFDDND